MLNWVLFGNRTFPKIKGAQFLSIGDEKTISAAIAASGIGRFKACEYKNGDEVQGQ